MHYISSIRHKPIDRLDIVLGIRPPHKDLPFAKLDALYKHILVGVEDIQPVLEILSFLFFCPLWQKGLASNIEEFLSLHPGDIELYLGGLSSLVNIEPERQQIDILHASLMDFLVDPTCLKELWINPRV